VLPEDDANTRLANAFHKSVDWDRYRQMQVLPEAGGWKRVLDLFKSEHVIEMEHNPKRFMVLLIDFDGQLDRLDVVKADIPSALASRVFVLGALSEPEAFRATLGSYETIGETLADECREDTYATWADNLLQHNASELARLRLHVRPILF